MKKYLLCFALLLNFISVKSQDNLKNYSFNNLFEPVDTLYVANNEEIILTTPVNSCLSNHSLIWGQDNQVFNFDSVGSLLNQYSLNGRGPGEFQNATYYSCDLDETFSVIDPSLSKISAYKYDSEQKQFLHNFDLLIPFNKPRQFTYTEQFFVTLNEFTTPNSETPALTVYNYSGEIIQNVGIVPNNAKLQLFIEGGGGITKDQNDNIYYSYLGDHRVWKWVSKEDSLAVFDKKPPYFVSPNLSNVNNKFGSAIESIRYAYEITRVTGLFFLEPDIVIQQIEPDNYLLEGTSQKVIIEIFDHSGNKKFSSVQIPNTISFTAGDIVYIPIDNYYNLLKEEGRIITHIGYKLRNF